VGWLPYHLGGSFVWNIRQENEQLTDCFICDLVLSLSLILSIGDLMKLCIHCKHLLARDGDPDFTLAKCAAFFNIHPVSGAKMYSYAFNQRMYLVNTGEGKCGEAAVFWEPKEEINDE